ncbi:MAG: hypothetical protein M3530_07275, partial [Thermoproteota archaeon]|nr:hypothetical protein [Thermoproteota archaeon]
MDVWGSEFQLNTLISIIVFFLSFFVILFYMRFRSRGSVAYNEPKYAALEVVLSKYAIKIENSTKMVGELRTKIDIIEAKMSARLEVQGAMKSVVDGTKDIATSLDIHENVYVDKDIAASSVTSQQNITRNKMNDTNMNKTLHQNTVFYILKLLNESPMTAREIQLDTKKTREHTSRLMKKLYTESLVTRDVDN